MPGQRASGLQSDPESISMHTEKEMTATLMPNGWQQSGLMTNAQSKIYVCGSVKIYVLYNFVSACACEM